MKKIENVSECMKFLEIPVNERNGDINPIVLYEILMDEVKVKKIISKLKLKTFW